MDTKARWIAFNVSMELSIQKETRDLTKEETLVHNQALVTLNLFLKIAEEQASEESENDGS